MPYVVTKNHFPEHYVDWADVMTKTAAEFEFGATKVLYDEKTLPTLVLHTEFRPGTLNTAFEILRSKYSSHIITILVMSGCIILMLCMYIIL